jgi:predicted  nucleic acid-binding Zn-ribbon protein
MYEIYFSKTKMDKKEYLLRILTQLEPVWDLAKWLKILVEQWHFAANELEIITQAVEWAIYTTEEQLAKEKLQKWLNALQRLKQIEAESKAKDEQDLAELDKMLEEI